MSAIKTRPTKAKVKNFLNRIPNEKHKREIYWHIPATSKVQLLLMVSRIYLGNNAQ